MALFNVPSIHAWLPNMNFHLFKIKGVSNVLVDICARSDDYTQPKVDCGAGQQIRNHFELEKPIRLYNVIVDLTGTSRFAL